MPMPHTRLLRATLLATSLLGAAGTSAIAQEASPSEPPPPQPSIQILPAPQPTPAGTPDATPDAMGEGLAEPGMQAPTLADAVEQAAATPAFGPAAASASSPYGSLADIQACPYKQIRAAYDEAVTGKDVLDTLAVEREILILCDERNTLVAKLLEGEQRLTGLLQPDPAPPVTVTGSTIAAPMPAPDPLDRLGADPSQTAKASASPTIQADTPQNAAVPAVLDNATSPPAQCEPLYATRYVSPGSAETGISAQAGITDTVTGTNLTIKVGDILTGGYVVESIAQAGVTLSRNDQRLPLPGFTAATEAEGFYAETPATNAPASPEETP